MSATLPGGTARTPRTAPTARTLRSRTALRRLLVLDALVTGANGLAYAVLPGPLGRLLGVGESLPPVLGGLLLLYGAAVGALAARRRPAPLAVTAVIGTNYAWAALSLLALAVWFSPTTAGAVWIPAQALVVGAFAVLQGMARRSVAE